MGQSTIHDPAFYQNGSGRISVRLQTEPGRVKNGSWPR